MVKVYCTVVFAKEDKLCNFLFHCFTGRRHLSKKTSTLEEEFLSDPASQIDVNRNGGNVSR